MKKVILYFFFSIGLSCLIAQAQPGKKKIFFNSLVSMKAVVVQPPPANLILVIGGQSNAGDRGNGGSSGSTQLSTTAYASYLGTYSNTHYIDNGAQYPTRQVYTRTAGSSPLGAEIGIVANLSSKFTTIEIIKYFVGSTAIKDQNRPNNFYPYSTTAGLFTTGFYKNDGTSFWQTNLTAVSQTKPNAIVWIQGEQDASLNTTTYLADLTAMVAAIRNGYGDQRIPFFYNQLHANFADPSPPVPGRSNVRADQAAFQSSINIMINMDDVSMNDPDGPNINVHYDSGPLAEMGKRFATAIKTYYNIP